MEEFERTCCIRGYHVYKKVWEAVWEAVGEELVCAKGVSLIAGMEYGMEW